MPSLTPSLEQTAEVDLELEKGNDGRTKLETDMAKKGARASTMDYLCKSMEENELDDDATMSAMVGALARSGKNEAKETAKWRKRTVVAFIVALVWSCALFALMLASQEMTKESHVDTRNNAVVLTGGNDEIVQVLPAANNKVSLFHSSVLDMEQLREVEEIAFTLPDGDEISEKLLGVSRTKATHMVQFSTALGNKLMVTPNAAYFQKGNSVPTEVCGQMKCGSLKVGDLDIDKLDAKLEVARAHEAAGRRLDEVADWCPPPAPCPCSGPNPPDFCVGVSILFGVSYKCGEGMPLPQAGSDYCENYGSIEYVLNYITSCVPPYRAMLQPWYDGEHKQIGAMCPAADTADTGDAAER